MGARVASLLLLAFAPLGACTRSEQLTLPKLGTIGTALLIARPTPQHPLMTSFALGDDSQYSTQLDDVPVLLLHYADDPEALQLPPGPIVVPDASAKGRPLLSGWRKVYRPSADGWVESDALTPEELLLRVPAFDYERCADQGGCLPEHPPARIERCRLACAPAEPSPAALPELGCPEGWEPVPDLAFEGVVPCRPPLPARSDCADPAQVRWAGAASCSDLGDACTARFKPGVNIDLYVDPSAAAGGDGRSEQTALNSLAAALVLATPGQTIGLAQGTLDETVNITTPDLTLQGACTRGTHIAPAQVPFAAITVHVSGFTARDLSVESPASGIALALDANGSFLERVHIGPPSAGPLFAGGPGLDSYAREARARELVVEGCDRGLLTHGGRLVLDSVVLAHNSGEGAFLEQSLLEANGLAVRENGLENNAAGMNVWASTITLHNVWLEGNGGHGAVLDIGSHAQIDDLIARGNGGQGGVEGKGLALTGWSTAVVRRIYVGDNYSEGVNLWNSSARISELYAERNGAPGTPRELGSINTGESSTLSLSRAAIVAAQGQALVAYIGAVLDAEDTLVQSEGDSSLDTLHAYRPARLSLKRVLVVRTTPDFGIRLTGTKSDGPSLFDFQDITVSGGIGGIKFVSGRLAGSFSRVRILNADLGVQNDAEVDFVEQVNISDLDISFSERKASVGISLGGRPLELSRFLIRGAQTGVEQPTPSSVTALKASDGRVYDCGVGVSAYESSQLDFMLKDVLLTDNDRSIVLRSP